MDNALPQRVPASGAHPDLGANADLYGRFIGSWTFNDIQPDSFVWRGEISDDGGASYRLEQEMRCRRR